MKSIYNIERQLRMKEIKVAELFAGVGGFNLGLTGDKHGRSSSSNYTDSMQSQNSRRYKIVWSNQYEPSTRSIQHASMIYTRYWPDCNHINENIEKVIDEDFDSIELHDLLVGGFPCQDYSVANALRNSKGLNGQKGVLWWSIYKILKKKGDKAPGFLMLENVDRLLSSPKAHRGLDFATILWSLNELNYAVEWRVIDASDYGMPQKRKRVFIIAFRKGTSLYNQLQSTKNKLAWLTTKGVIANSFPVEVQEKKSKVVSSLDAKNSDLSLNASKEQLLSKFNSIPRRKANVFLNSGVMIRGDFVTTKLDAKNEDSAGLGSVLLDESEVAENYPDYYIDERKPLNRSIEKFMSDGTIKTINTVGELWEYLKGSKKEIKINRDDIRYTYKEGRMSYPDELDKPSRTIITGEGGPTPSRYKHVIQVNGKLRRLVPEELEALNMFPPGFTKHEKISDSKRAFLMGNALVVGVVERLGKELAKRIKDEELH